MAEESLGFRTGWLFGCRLQEGKSSPHPNFARLDRCDAQIPPPRQPRLSAALRLPGSLARSLGRPGPCAALPLPPAPSLCFMQIRVQPPFQALSPPPCRRGSPPPPPRPAASSPGRPARPPPPGGRRASPARRGARPRGRPGTAAALTGARRTPRGPDLSPAGAWRKSWERSGERGPQARNPHSGSSLGVADPRGLDSKRISAVRPKAGGGTVGWTRVREGAHGSLRPRKLGRTLGRARADRGQGPWPATATWGLLLFSSLRSHRLKDPRLCVEGVGRGE